MDHNPYSPPTAPVADIPIDQAAKNHAVWTACKLYWASFGISLISLVLDIIGAPDAGSMVSGIVGAVLGGAIGLLITRWIVSKLKAGRNWMRLLLTICTALGFISIVIFWSFYRRNVFPLYADDPINAIQVALQAILGFYAVVLLNTPSARAWFHRRINPPRG
jgi:nitrate/nitrite transporter NarK